VGVAPPIVTPAEQLAIAAKLGLSIAQVTALGHALGLSPGAVWEWLKRKLKEPGKKLPRPGRGLPAPGTMKLLLLALGAYLLTKGGGREADMAKYALVAVLAYFYFRKGK